MTEIKDSGGRLSADMCFVTEVILCTKMRRGNGTKKNPIRVITEIFTKEGMKIAEYDPQIEDLKKDALSDIL